MQHAEIKGMREMRKEMRVGRHLEILANIS